MSEIDTPSYEFALALAAPCVPEFYMIKPDTWHPLGDRRLPHTSLATAQRSAVEKIESLLQVCGIAQESKPIFVRAFRDAKITKLLYMVKITALPTDPSVVVRTKVVINQTGSQHELIRMVHEIMWGRIDQPAIYF